MDKENDGDLAGNVLCQPGAGFTSCGVAVKAEEHFSGVLAFRKETVKGFARNAAQRKIEMCIRDRYSAWKWQAASFPVQAPLAGAGWLHR